MMRRTPKQVLQKMPTGIEGLDEATRGGLPRQRNTLVLASSGAGKTVLALQTLVNGARFGNEPGIFVTFEERVPHVIQNAATFGWNLPSLEREKLFLLDVRVPPETVQAGSFDLVGTLASIGQKAKQMGAKRIVFDAVDVLLMLLDDPKLERREMCRLNEWLHDSGMTGIITAKADSPDGTLSTRYSFLPFMADCVVQLSQRYTDHVALRNMRVVKYRGSAFSENEAPMVIGPEGIEIASIGSGESDYPVSTERISSGIERLDRMMDGGYFRGTSVLIAGSPGTAKSTLSGAFVEAACLRKERALYISFDESGPEVVRNLASVNIDLGRHVQSGLLRMVSMRSEAISAREHLVRLRKLITEHQPRCVVVDPLSALLKAGGAVAAHSVVNRLLHLTKSNGITVVLTSLLGSSTPGDEDSMIAVSTVADTWIQLSYAIQGGERNRALTIIKSRGTRHSNQVRELVLGDQGITLADVYASSGEVLMGTLRWEREQTERAERERLREEVIRKRMELEFSQRKLDAQIELLQREMQQQQTELDWLIQEEQARESRSGQHRAELERKRGADAEKSLPRK